MPTFLDENRVLHLFFGYGDLVPAYCKGKESSSCYDSFAVIEMNKPRQIDQLVSPKEQKEEGQLVLRMFFSDIRSLNNIIHKLQTIRRSMNGEDVSLHNYENLAGEFVLDKNLLERWIEINPQTEEDRGRLAEELGIDKEKVANYNVANQIYRSSKVGN